MNNPEQQPAGSAESIRDERLRHLDAGLHNLQLARAGLRPEVVPTPGFFQPVVATEVPTAADSLEDLRSHINKLEDTEC